MTVQVDDGADAGDQTPAPQDRSTDVRRVVVTHGRSSIRVRLQVRDLGPGNQLAQVLVRGPRGVGGLAAVVRQRGKDRVLSETWYDGDADERRCRQTTGSIRPRLNQAVLSIPRACLDDPAWVRVSVIYATFDGRPASMKEFNADDALSDEFENFIGNGTSPKIYSD